MNQEFLYIILIIALGYILKRVNILREEDGAVISKIIFKITLPALVIVTFNRVNIETSLLMLPVFVIMYSILMALIGIVLFRKEDREITGAFLMLATSFNVGLFAFPLVLVMWGMNGITYFSMFDIGASLTTFGLAYLLGSYFSKQGLELKPTAILKKLGTSIPLMTYMIAGILNFSQIKLPDSFISIAETLSQANIPLSLLLLGLYLNFRFERGLIKPIMKFLLYRYSFALILGISLYFILPFDEQFRYTLIMGYLLPSAATVLAFSVEFNYRIETTRLVAAISNLSILVGIVVLYAFSLLI